MGGHFDKLRGGVALGTLVLAVLASAAQAQQNTARGAAAATPAAEGPVVLDQITVQGEGQPAARCWAGRRPRG